MNISRLQADKLIVGTNDVSYVPPDTSPNGTAVLNGPVYIGKPSSSPEYEGVLNVASNGASQNSLDPQPAYNSTLAIKADGNLTVAGDDKTANALLISGGSSVDTIRVVGDMHVTGSVDCGNKGRLAAALAVARALPPKSFDIEHPIKGKGWRLRYVCLEGPEAAVYYRGRLKESNVINLPEHWKGLVHEDSITVQLQPIGRQQNLVIQEFNNEFIVIAEDSTNTDLITDLSTIDCFYHVYGERKDVNPVLVEYEGNDRYDYPDPNWNEESDMKFEDRNFRDPNYLYPRNTITS
tara:strand:- start:24 stop:905 length:882 start_codon:yes stop_codon:yes gene_type:complete